MSYLQSCHIVGLGGSFKVIIIGVCVFFQGLAQYSDEKGQGVGYFHGCSCSFLKHHCHIQRCLRFVQKGLLAPRLIDHALSLITIPGRKIVLSSAKKAQFFQNQMHSVEVHIEGLARTFSSK